MSQLPYTGPGMDPMRYGVRGQEQPIMMGTLGGGGGEKNLLGTAGPGGYLQRIQRQMQNRAPQNLYGQLQRMFGGGIFGGGPQPQPVGVGVPDTAANRIYGQPARRPQGGYNRGINPGGMYTGGQGGGFGSPFGGSMRGRQQPQYGGGYGGGMGGGYGGGFPGYGGGFPGYGGGMGGGYGMPSPPNMGYGNRFPGMQFSGPFAQPMMPQNYGMGGGFGGGYPMPQPRMPYPQPQFPMMGGGYGGGMGGGYGGGFGDMIQMFDRY